MAFQISLDQPAQLATSAPQADQKAIGINHLPQELLAETFKYITDVRDKANLRSVCTTWKHVVDHWSFDKFWQNTYEMARQTYADAYKTYIKVLKPSVNKPPKLAAIVWNDQPETSFQEATKQVTGAQKKVEVKTERIVAHRARNTELQKVERRKKIAIKVAFAVAMILCTAALITVVAMTAHAVVPAVFGSIVVFVVGLAVHTFVQKYFLKL